MHKENFDRNKIRILSLVSFFMGFAQASIVYVLSSYFKDISGTENVGIFYFIGYAVSMAVLLYLHNLVRRFGKTNVFVVSLFLKIVVISMLMISPVSKLLLIPLVLYLIFGAIEWASLDVLLESFSQDKLSGRIRGKHLAILNMGFLLGPLVSTHLINHYGFHGIFLLLFILNSIIFFISLLGLKDFNECPNKKIQLIELFKRIYREKDILRIYYISFILEFFFALMTIYTPIYLIDLGISWEDIGFIFTIMLIPFVVVQYPIGILADKKWGEKECIIGALFLIGIFTSIIYFVNTSDILVWALVLFVGRVGAALVEVLRESYFYKKIDGDDVDLIYFFRTSMPVGYILSTLISSVLLLLFPVKFVFLFIGVLVLTALYPAARLVDSESEAEVGRLSA